MKTPLGSAFDTNDDEARLDTGMKVKEAVARAREWWEKKGRRMVSEKAAEVPGDATGILDGLPWELLDKRERLVVIKFWHHFYVRKPDLVGDDDDAARDLTRRGLIH